VLFNSLTRRLLGWLLNNRPKFFPAFATHTASVVVTKWAGTGQFGEAFNRNHFQDAVAFVRPLNVAEAVVHTQRQMHHFFPEKVLLTVIDTRGVTIQKHVHHSLEICPSSTVAVGAGFSFGHAQRDNY